VLRRLHHKKLCDLNSSPNIIRLIKSRRTRQPEHVARIGGGEIHSGLLCGNVKKRDHFENLEVDRMIILKLIFMKCDRAWTELMWLREGQVGGACESGVKYSAYIKCGEFLEKLITC